jgi:hypothetical protein
MAQPFLALITPLSSGPVDPGYNPPGVGPGLPGGPLPGTPPGPVDPGYSPPWARPPVDRLFRLVSVAPLAGLLASGVHPTCLRNWGGGWDRGEAPTACRCAPVAPNLHPTGRRPASARHLGPPDIPPGFWGGGMGGSRRSRLRAPDCAPPDYLQSRQRW